jgi:hypothetical protein
MNDLINRMYGDKDVTIQAFKQIGEIKNNRYFVCDGRFQSISFVANDDNKITITYKTLHEELYDCGLRKLEDTLITLAFPAWLTSVHYDFDSKFNDVTILYYGKEPDAPLYKIIITWKNQ